MKKVITLTLNNLKIINNLASIFATEEDKIQLENNNNKEKEYKELEAIIKSKVPTKIPVNEIVSIGEFEKYNKYTPIATSLHSFKKLKTNYGSSVTTNSLVNQSNAMDIDNNIEIQFNNIELNVSSLICLSKHHYALQLLWNYLKNNNTILPFDIQLSVLYLLIHSFQFGNLNNNNNNNNNDNIEVNYKEIEEYIIDNINKINKDKQKKITSNLIETIIAYLINTKRYELLIEWLNQLQSNLFNGNNNNSNGNTSNNNVKNKDNEKINTIIDIGKLLANLFQLCSKFFGN